MRSIILTAFFCLILTSSFSQNGKRFEYQTGEFGNLIITPVFDQSKGQGKHGEANCSDLAYVNNLVYGVIKEVFPKEKLFKIHLNSSYLIYFNSKGEIINCTFILNPVDTNIISEVDLYNLYIKFKRTKVDMNIVRITGGNDVPPGEIYDYSTIFGSIVPFEYRNDPRLKK